MLVAQELVALVLITVVLEELVLSVSTGLMLVAPVVVLTARVAPFQLLEYQMVLWVCRFDTLGKLVSAHRAGVPTTPGWWVTPGRWVGAPAAEPYGSAPTIPFDTLVTGMGYPPSASSSTP